MAISQRLLCADGQGQLAIHLQCFHGGAAGGSATGHAAASPPEVIGPRLIAWMKERHKLARNGIDREPSRAFAQRAGDTGERQILQMRLTFLSDRVDVIHMEARLLI